MNETQYYANFNTCAHCRLLITMEHELLKYWPSREKFSETETPRDLIKFYHKECFIEHYLQEKRREVK